MTMAAPPHASRCCSRRRKRNLAITLAGASVCPAVFAFSPSASQHRFKDQINLRKRALASTSSLHEVSSKIGFEFEVHNSISSISAHDWDLCLAPDGSSSPFMEHAWLRCLEESGCASPATGWVPQHLSVKIDGTRSVYVPIYIKGHSQGEFIFDSGWAEAAHSNDIQYYPKLLVGVPFTPATGERILLHPDIRKNWKEEEIADLRVLVGKFLRQISTSNNLSSVHLNFITDKEATDIAGALMDARKSSTSEEERNARLETKVKSMLDLLTYSDKDDYLRRTSMQYHWTNKNKRNGKPYDSFEDYLDAFKSKRRITIRRERTVLDEESIRIDAVVGNDILMVDGLVERMYEVYMSTVKKMIFGRQYLTLEFFQMLAQSDFCRNLCFLCVRSCESGDELSAKDVFAGTFNIINNGIFYGRYWGCLPGREIKNLHFETCYWAAIEHCIENGLRKMEPGAGGGDYKRARGFDPAMIHSAHYICNPGLRRAVHQFLDFETPGNVEVTEYLLAKSSVGSGDNNIIS